MVQWFFEDHQNLLKTDSKISWVKFQGWANSSYAVKLDNFTLLRINIIKVL